MKKTHSRHLSNKALWTVILVICLMVGTLAGCSSSKPKTFPNGIQAGSTQSSNNGSIATDPAAAGLPAPGTSSGSSQGSNNGSIATDPAAAGLPSSGSSAGSSQGSNNGSIATDPGAAGLPSSGSSAGSSQGSTPGSIATDPGAAGLPSSGSSGSTPGSMATDPGAAGLPSSGASGSTPGYSAGSSDTTPGYSGGSSGTSSIGSSGFIIGSTAPSTYPDDPKMHIIIDGKDMFVPSKVSDWEAAGFNVILSPATSAHTGMYTQSGRLGVDGHINSDIGIGARVVGGPFGDDLCITNVWFNDFGYKDMFFPDGTMPNEAWLKDYVLPDMRLMSGQYIVGQKYDFSSKLDIFGDYPEISSYDINGIICNRWRESTGWQIVGNGDPFYPGITRYHYIDGSKEITFTVQEYNSISYGVEVYPEELVGFELAYEGFYQ